jgi:hypothetical protein
MVHLVRQEKDAKERNHDWEDGAQHNEEEYEGRENDPVEQGVEIRRLEGKLLIDITWNV